MTMYRKRHKKKRYGFRIILEKGTIRHKIALQSLQSMGDDPTSPTHDYEIFIGTIAQKTLYDDMIRANTRIINREEQTRLKI